jgi:hypothetical protein
MNTSIAAKTSTPVYCWDHFPYLFKVVNLQNARNPPALFTLQMLYFFVYSRARTLSADVAKLEQDDLTYHQI